MERVRRVKEGLRGMTLGGRLSRLWMVMWLTGLVMLRALFMLPFRDIDITTDPRAIAKSGQDG